MNAMLERQDETQNYSLSLQCDAYHAHQAQNIRAISHKQNDLMGLKEFWGYRIDEAATFPSRVDPGSVRLQTGFLQAIPSGTYEPLHQLLVFSSPSSTDEQRQAADEPAATEPNSLTPAMREDALLQVEIIMRAKDFRVALADLARYDRIDVSTVARVTGTSRQAIHKWIHSARERTGKKDAHQRFRRLLTVWKWWAKLRTPDYLAYWLMMSTPQGSIFDAIESLADEAPLELVVTQIAARAKKAVARRLIERDQFAGLPGNATQQALF